MSGKATVGFEGDKAFLDKLSRLGDGMTAAVARAAEASLQAPKRAMQNFMAEHRQTGGTEKSWGEETVIEGDKVRVAMGYRLDKSDRRGLPALILNIGKPGQEPTFFIDKAVDENRTAIRAAQRQALEDECRREGLL